MLPIGRIGITVLLSCVALAAIAGQRIDPARMDRAQAVANAGPPDTAVVGNWDVWIPGAVFHSTDGRNIYRHYQPGAAMNRLEIAADGRYRWGNRSGRLEEVRPWHHQPGRRYYRVRHPGGDEYEFYRSDDDRLIVLFGGVGGHAATGTRLGAAPAAGGGPSRGTPGSTRAASPAHAVGERVDVEWSGGWYPARILQVKDGRFLIRYDGYGSQWDEWVTPARIRKPASARATD